MNRTASFDVTWPQHGERPGVSEALVPLMKRLFDALTTRPVEAVPVEDATRAVLAYLATPAGRTDANCTAVDHFLCLGEFDWPDLPDRLQDVLGDMAGALHDTVSHPEVAANFESTPEQLLGRLTASQ
jgi:hypothetical protein